MQIPLYILGLLMRFGPQHGYRIRKIIGEELADFTGIKLSVIYYHLEKMEREGLLHGIREKISGRPEKTRYSVTQAGRAAFRRILGENRCTRGSGRHDNNSRASENAKTLHPRTPQRGSLTTSTTAGWPDLTAAMARASAGARSFGSVIGPSPWAPMPRATVA